MTAKLLDPIPPGEVLYEEFMKPLGVSINALAREIAVPPNRISEIVGGKRAITADTALRLGKYFGVSRKSGLDCRWITTCVSPSARPGRRPSAACGCMQPENCAYGKAQTHLPPHGTDTGFQGNDSGARAA